MPEYSNYEYGKQENVQLATNIILYISIILDAVVEYKKVATPTFVFRFNKFPKFDLPVLNMPGTRNVPLGEFKIENNIIPCNCSLIKVRLKILMLHFIIYITTFLIRNLHQFLISQALPGLRSRVMATGVTRCLKSCFTPPPSVLTAPAQGGNSQDTRGKIWNSLKMKTLGLHSCLAQLE